MTPIFNAAECQRLGRCVGCGFHVKTQGHHPACELNHLERSDAHG